ncbi:phage holin family protein [Janibacter sp. GXQ6167]|uniref:phage holin family protein n=1 Tax=Janibacter sp. GXQ6167 TaxID=3240791 RepID=UPI003524C618
MSIDRVDRTATSSAAARRLVGEPEPGANERTIGQLVADVTTDLGTIVRDEIQLAKTEVTKGVSIAGKGIGMLAGAAFVGLLGLIFLFHTIAQVIAIWLPMWAGYLITTVLLFLIAAIVGLVGFKAVKKAKPVPERAIAQGKETVEAIKPGS